MTGKNLVSLLLSDCSVMSPDELLFYFKRYVVISIVITQGAKADSFGGDEGVVFWLLLQDGSSGGRFLRDSFQLDYV